VGGGGDGERQRLGQRGELGGGLLLVCCGGREGGRGVDCRVGHFGGGVEGCPPK